MFLLHATTMRVLVVSHAIATLKYDREKGRAMGKSISMLQKELIL